MIRQKGITTLVGIIIIVAVAMVLFGGVFAYQYLTPSQMATEENSPQIIGGDKDSHGCLIGAGYSWCEVKQKCLRVWEEPCESDQTNVPIELYMWPDKNSFDLTNKTFRAIGAGTDYKKYTNSIKIETTKSTLFYRWPGKIAGFEEYYDFQWLYSTIKNWQGTDWFFGVKGVIQNDGSIMADEIYLPTN